MPDKEPTDEELLAELNKELEKNQQETIVNDTLNQNDTILNDTIPESNINDQYSDQYGGGQIATFQDNIITTGSDVSILLMVILFILFIIQAIRKAYSYFTLQSKLKQLQNPLEEAKPLPAEHLTPINPIYDHTSYAVYNTVFEDREIYMQKKKEGAPPSILKEILLKRAIKCIAKFSAIQRDGMGIRKNWNQDLLPKEVWNDFNAAQRNIQSEIESVVRENSMYQFNWGPPHRTDIFGKAKEVHGRDVELRKKDFYRKIQQQRLQNGGNNPPNPRSFGGGFNSGFLNQQNNNKSNKNKKLTKKEKQELKRQKKTND